jgi:predicted NBD/HSP70 family sugar kinase
MLSLEERLRPSDKSVRLGIDVGGTKLLIVGYGRDSVKTWRFPTAGNCGPAEITARVQEVRHEVGEGVAGIAIPGLVGADGTIGDCDVLPKLSGWNPLKDLSVGAVLNDGDAALVAVAASELPGATVAAVGSGTAIAAAIQVGGVRVRSVRPFACELGYVPFGREGRMDDYGAGKFLLQRLGMEPTQVHEALERGEPHVIQAVQEAGEAFGIALVTLLHLVHPQRIGLYGGTLSYRGYLESAMETVERLGHPAMLPSCQIAVAEDPTRVVAAGALLEALR